MIEQKKINIVRHIEDIDDLRENRDGSIDWKKKDNAIQIADKIIKEAQEDSSSILLFVISTKKRVQQTAGLVIGEIKKKTKLKTILFEEPNIREMDQGEFKIPHDYKYGVFRPEIKRAWDIFWDETFIRKNFAYRFGSCFNGNGEKEYKDLENFFSKTGEKYIEFCLRLYSSVLEMAKNPDLINREKIKIIVMTHSAPLLIFKELEDIAKKISIEGFDFKIGTLMQICWDNFKKRIINGIANYGYVESLSINYINDPRVLKKLEDEIMFMKETLNKQTQNIL